MDNTWMFGGLLLFLVIWVFVLNLVSRLTGWAKLAAFYRSDEPYHGKIFRFQSIAMRMGGGYNNSVRVGSSPRGLYLSPFFLFRPGHPSLFVRWEEISVTRVKKRGIKRIELRFQRAADIPVIINNRLARRLEETAGRQWPENEWSRPDFSAHGGHP